MADTPLPPDERDALAAELALGLLDGEERAAALRSLMADPDFTPGMIDAWHHRLAPLYDHYAPIAPPNTLWNGIQSRIGNPTTVDEPLLKRLRLWRGGAIAASALAAALALVLVTHPVQAPVAPLPPEQVVVAQMAGAPDGPVVLARFDPQTGRLTLQPTGIKAGPLKPELWVIPSDGRPRSLGLITADADSSIIVGPDHRPFMADGATLAVSMEPATGVPHDAPSSTPVAAGKISLI